MKPLMVIYHANCADGFASAMCARVYSENMGHEEEPEFVPANYGDDPPDVSGRTVLVLDFSYPRDVLLKMHEAAKGLFVCDHHKTAAKDLDGLDFCLFDMGKSGARMAWEHFNLFHEPPDIIKYVEDRDLWKWEMPFSREVNAYIRSFPLAVESWEPFFLWDFQRQPKQRDAIVQAGAAIIRDQERYVDAKRKNPAFVELAGYRVPVVNTTHLVSEVLHALCQDHPFAVGYFDLLSEGKRIFSLRSAGDVDVAEIAKNLGGGGHPKAAGFTVTIDQERVF